MEMSFIFMEEVREIIPDTKIIFRRKWNVKDAVVIMSDDLTFLRVLQGNRCPFKKDGGLDFAILKDETGKTDDDTLQSPYSL